MRRLTKAQHLEKIVYELTHRIHWECPCCGNSQESNDDDTEQEFAEQLYDRGVRYKKMKYMSGVLCRDCYLDKEVQNSSL